MDDLKEQMKDHFIKYASYVILDRAIPNVVDGLKPVQRRILEILWRQNDEKFHKVANMVGQAMQLHPHGDAPIYEALINLASKGFVMDTQGNFGNIFTGDPAAAARYIEARLSKFALEVAFNAKTTEWQLSYDGRKNEPIALPMKFPLLLAQGAEGICVDAHLILTFDQPPALGTTGTIRIPAGPHGWLRVQSSRFDDRPESYSRR